jgi:hypothetical protein
MLNKWGPDLFVDFHTTNGTWHGYRLTWAPAYHTIGDKRLFDYSWYEMLPTITEQVKKNYDLNFGPYGWYNLRDGWPPKKIETYNHHPRYLVNQMGLRNRMAILSETFAHDRFYIRIQSAYAFANEILNFFVIHGQEIKKHNKRAESASKEIEGETLGLRFSKIPMEESFTLRTYDYAPYVNDMGELNYARTGAIVHYDSVLNYSAFEAEFQLKAPKAYYLPKRLQLVKRLLDIQGIQNYPLKSDSMAKVEILEIQSVKQANRAFQGHKLMQIEEHRWNTVNTYELAEGGFIVPMNQSLSRLAFYLLEGLSDDGIVNWNLIGEEIEGIDTPSSKDYPVLRILDK